MSILQEAAGKLSDHMATVGGMDHQQMIDPATIDLLITVIASLAKEFGKCLAERKAAKNAGVIGKMKVRRHNRRFLGREKYTQIGAALDEAVFNLGRVSTHEYVVELVNAGQAV